MKGVEEDSFGSEAEDTKGAYDARLSVFLSQKERYILRICSVDTAKPSENLGVT